MQIKHTRARAIGLEIQICTNKFTATRSSTTACFYLNFLSHSTTPRPSSVAPRERFQPTFHAFLSHLASSARNSLNIPREKANGKQGFKVGNILSRGDKGSPSRGFSSKSEFTRTERSGSLLRRSKGSDVHREESVSVGQKIERGRPSLWVYMLTSRLPHTVKYAAMHASISRLGCNVCSH